MGNMRRIDEALIPYKIDSELSRLNQTSGSKAFKTSKGLFQLIQQANWASPS
jgi:thiamine biosynthesis lipoprotein ApbE